jgi:hypothetical protein
LRVIKDQIAQLDHGMELMGEGESPVTPYTAAASRHGAAEDVRLTRESLLEAAAVTDEFLDELESFGLVSAGRGGIYDQDALLVARTAGELAEYGLQPRHLRSIRGAAEREVGLVEQIITPALRQRSAEAKGRASEAATDIARLTTRLHAALVDQGVSALLH